MNRLYIKCSYIQLVRLILFLAVFCCCKTEFTAEGADKAPTTGAKDETKVSTTGDQEKTENADDSWAFGLELYG